MTPERQTRTAPRRCFNGGFVDTRPIIPMERPSFIARLLGRGR